MCDFTSLGLPSAAVPPWGAPAREVPGWRFRGDTAPRARGRDCFDPRAGSPPTFSACEAPDGRPAGSGAMSAVSIAPLIIVNPVSKPRLGRVLMPQIGDGRLSPISEVKQNGLGGLLRWVGPQCCVSQCSGSLKRFSPQTGFRSNHISKGDTNRPVSPGAS